MDRPFCIFVAALLLYAVLMGYMTGSIIFF